MSRAIPLVDLKKFTSGTAEERKQFVDELGHAFQEFGHEVPGVVDELLHLHDLSSNVTHNWPGRVAAGAAGTTAYA